MTVPYATQAELEDYLGTDAPVDEARLRERASELIDSKVLAYFQVDQDTQLAVDPKVAEALRDACCAQVEFWALVGEEHDIEGMAEERVNVMSLGVELPPELAPRAQRHLEQRGLLNFSPVPRTLDQLLWP